MKIKGVSHPIPTIFANRIYNEGKSVFIGKKYLGKVVPGDKFVIYESRGAKAYTGWGDIRHIGKEKSSSIIEKYGNNLIITKEEFKEYSKNNSEMTVIEFENFIKFKKPVKPSRFVSIGGKYIYEDEFKTIKNHKD